MEEEAHGIVIVGAGVSGLSTALALHRKGIASLLLEKSETLRASGVAIGLHANGWKCLEELGIAADLRETANCLTAYHEVSQERNKTSHSPMRREVRCVKRKDLIETMAKNLPSGTIRFGCHVVAIDQDPGTGHGAILTTVDGCTIRAKVLIGCDGGNSVVAKYLGISAPINIPRTVLLGFTRYPHGHPFGTEFLQLKLKGEQFFVGVLPMTPNLVHVMLITVPATTGTITKDVSATKDFMLEELRARGCASEIIEMVRNSDPESLYMANNIWFRPPWQVACSTFNKGTVTVAGDAMHAMGVVIGQGGSSSLEDAIVLARSLSRAAAKKDYGVAVQEYVKERRLRVTLLCMKSLFVAVSEVFESLLMKLACSIVLAFLGRWDEENYDCGRL